MGGVGAVPFGTGGDTLTESTSFGDELGGEFGFERIGMIGSGRREVRGCRQTCLFSF